MHTASNFFPFFFFGKILHAISSIEHFFSKIIIFNLNLFISFGKHPFIFYGVSLQRETVEKILQESSSSYSVICDNLKKVYRGRHGNAEKIAVRGISLSMSSGQCFGVLGPNGAGKTTLINMVSSNNNNNWIQEGCGL